ncbi:MAG: hypothetical protein H0W50_01315 [Parachlamydiaceae bacterium]|nr:hypothetical protein [Parachlamydiaceae bacterium]
MQINALGNQLSNLWSYFFEESVTNELDLTVTSIFSEFFPMEVVREITKYADFDTSKILLSVSKEMNNVFLVKMKQEGN